LIKKERNKYMPNFNGTGPRGEGPMTGRGMGSCGGQTRGRGQGCGRGFGFRRFFSQKEEVEDLKTYQEDLKAELKAVEEELKNDK
jgi:Family of unknown function (DUF5320)